MQFFSSGNNLHITCQILFSGKNLKLSSAEFAQRVERLIKALRTS